MNKTPITIAHDLYTALETGQFGESLNQFVHADAVFMEYPNAITPHGAARDPQQMKEGSQRGAQLLAWQRYEVRDAIEHGDTAIMRVTWTAEVGRDVGPFRVGQKLTAHLAQFIQCRDGRIARLETFDCYEPFAQ
jgi:ketosteroid isomerase-like protein